MDQAKRIDGLRLVVVMALLVPLFAVADVASDNGPAPVEAAVEGDVVPLVPERLLDTRPGHATADGRSEGQGAVASGERYELVVAGRGQVPNDADAALLNVTAVLADAAGHLTVWPCGEERPDPASNVNYTPGGAFPNAVLAKIGAGGKVCIYTHAATHLVVDVNGYVPAGGGLVPSNPARLADTRPGHATIDGRLAGGGAIGAGRTLAVEVADRGGVPADAVAVWLNVTAVLADAAGHLTVWPCGEERPDPASNVNYTPGGAFPNAVLAKIGAGGKVCIYTHAATHLVVDVNGHVDPGADLSMSAPVRMLETRTGNATFDGNSQHTEPVGAGKVIEFRVAGRGPVPVDATAAFMNITAVRAADAGHLTVFPCDEPRPDAASNVNYTAGGAFPNAVFAKLSADGRVCIYTHATTHVIADVVGSTTRTSASLAGVTLATDPVEPFDRIDIAGLDLGADLSEFGVVIDLPEGQRDLPVFTDDAGPYIVAPLVPDDPTKAGTVRLRLVLGSERSAAFAVPILALPAAPGTWDEIVTSLLALADARAVDAGLTRDELRAIAVEDVPAHLLAARMLIGFFDHPSGDDLSDLLTGSVVDASPAELALAESIIADLGLHDAAAALADGAAPAADRSAPESFSPDEPAAAASERVGRLTESVAQCRTTNRVIPDAEQLSDLMEDGVDGIIRSDGAERQVLDAIATITEYGGMLPGVYGELIGLVGTVFATIELTKYIDSITLPTRFDALNVDGTVTTFNEDFTTPGHVVGIELVAASTGGDVGAWVHKLFGSVFGVLRGKLLGYAFEGTKWSNLEQHLIVQLHGVLEGTAFGAALNQLGPGLRPYCAEPFRVSVLPSVFAAEHYVTMDSVNGNFAADVSSLDYRPTKLGADRIRVRAIAEVFAGRSVEGSLPVETKPIIIDVNPDDVVLDNPDEWFTLDITVHNASNPIVEVITPTETLVTSPGLEVFNYEAPSYPHVIVVRSASISGLRGAGAPERLDTVDVRLDDIRLLPENETLEIGETQQMIVRDVSDNVVDAADISWSATGGPITDAGLYTAGDTPGTYEITATLKVDPTKVATTTVTISGDSCIYGAWDLQVPRYLADLTAAYPNTGMTRRYDGGHERITFVAKEDGDLYATYSMDVDLVISSITDDSTSTLERRGWESGDFFIDDAGELQHIIDEGAYEGRLTVTDQWGTSVSPWMEGLGGPLSQAGSLFSHGFHCNGDNELALHPDGYHADLTTYWTRIG
ncbi:hypothetical protein BDK89_0172 [Ilumatobacter fluminis]|uniref:Uncharacterized protein n=1 Tax=Ilumatobacter fluminis TaxID=467091 RepID=A0A4R7HUH9_9ACTN|nr:hypothetical protein [Ilumatobacter fluminis]TDT14617.1 hypothetical protein BDK89_0172 [Ilumatobacter fluminis]